MCAGPGGKTALLGSEACASGATALATELSAHRASLVEDSITAISSRFPELIPGRNRRFNQVSRGDVFADTSRRSLFWFGGASASPRGQVDQKTRESSRPGRTATVIVAKRTEFSGSGWFSRLRDVFSSR